MNISQDIKTSLSIDPIKLHKMAFLYNALEEGWKINKKKDMYIFTKNHDNININFGCLLDLDPESTRGPVLFFTNNM